MSGVLNNIEVTVLKTENPLKKCSLWSRAGAPGMRSYWVDANVTRFYCGALSSRSQKKCWCILLCNEIGSHPIPTNPAQQCVCSGFDWVPGVNGLIVMYKVSNLNYEKGPTFTPEGRAEIYRMYPDSIISLAA